MMREVVARIRAAALRHNLGVVRQFCVRAGNSSRVVAMVKANAYGHGLLSAAHVLSSADALGVAVIDEALALRAGGILTPVVVLEGVFSAEELRVAVANDFSIVVHQREQVDLLLATALSRQPDVWLKLDTGMHRLGLPPASAKQVVDALRSVARLQGVMTHFACADETAHPLTAVQLSALTEFAQAARLPASAANSAAIVSLPTAQLDVVRPGIMLYGGTPQAGRAASDFDLQPVMTLTARVIAINDVSRGDSVGYGAAWTAARDSRIGVVGIGYGDGYPRHAPSGTPVLVGNGVVPLVGRVSMDMITVDLTDRPDVRIGDAAILWGDGLPADDVARHAGTISYELFCRLTSRVRFEYTD